MKALVAGWFSFKDGHATAGDLLARDLVCKWLDHAGWRYDIAVASPFSGGIPLHHAHPTEYAAAIFVCGPFERKLLEAEFLGRFARCYVVGVNVTMPVPLDEWNPFDVVIERNSSLRTRPDIVFLSDTPLVPVVGRCLVEPYQGAIDNIAHAAIDRLLASRNLAVVSIDTRLDTNSTGLRSPAEIEALLGRMDVVVTTRLHGMVLALKNGVPVLAIDPEPGGAKIMRQAEAIGWPLAFTADAVNDQQLQQALEYCLTGSGRSDARRCCERAVTMLGEMPREFIAALRCAVLPSPKHLERKAFAESFGCNRSVTIVITTYNHAHFLAEAIDSVIGQNHPADEIIVVDDGSSDDPDTVVASRPGVQIIRQRNQGLASARNTGLWAASSEAIVFLDADDRLLPNALEQGLACLAREPRSGLVYGGHRCTDAGWRPIGEDRYDPVGRTGDPYTDLLHGNLIGMHAAVMYSRDRLREIGGFDTGLQRCEDYDVYLRMAQTHPITSHPNTVAEYCIHSANIPSDNRDMLRSILKVHERQKSFALARSDTAKAWHRGRSILRDYYSQQTLVSAKQAWMQSSHKLLAVRGLLNSMLMSPRPAARMAVRAVQRRLIDVVHSGVAYGRGHSRSAPALGRVRFGDFDRSHPIDNDFGFGRGTPIDRGYIEDFLSHHAKDIRGRVLEVGDDAYSRRFGGRQITHQDILHIDPSNTRATIVGDLAKPGVLPTAAFDCMILTQTLHLIYDMVSAVREIQRALKPDGVVLLTVPGISPIDRGEWRDSWHWSLTEVSARRLFNDVFGADHVEAETQGNVFAATAFLHGLALEEVPRWKLSTKDLAFPVIVSVRAQKASGS